jgi:hypothetical protein
MLAKDPVVFAADGFDQTHELDYVNERVVSRIARLFAASRRRSHGEIGIPTTSLPAAYKSVANKIGRPNRYECRRR